MSKQPRRKNSIRRPNWDYRTPAFYFVTICTFQRLHYFDSPSMKLLAETLWRQLPTFDACDHIKLDAWVVMPNHTHFLFYLSETVEYRSMPLANYFMPRSVGAVIGAYKGIVARRAKPMVDDSDFKLWQRGYYDRIVRDEDELNRVREYIRLNPDRWMEDRDNLDRLLESMDYHG